MFDYIKHKSLMTNEVYSAPIPHESLWLLFDCKTLSLRELKQNYEVLRNSPSSCDRDIDQLRLVFREKQQLRKEFVPTPMIGVMEDTPIVEGGSHLEDLLSLFGCSKEGKSSFSIPFMKKPKKTN
jgi:hypothetical protein